VPLRRLCLELINNIRINKMNNNIEFKGKKAFIVNREDSKDFFEIMKKNNITRIVDGVEHTNDMYDENHPEDIITAMFYCRDHSIAIGFNLHFDQLMFLFEDKNYIGCDIPAIISSGGATNTISMNGGDYGILQKADEYEKLYKAYKAYDKVYFNKKDN
jgi:hypothetical protein